MTGLRTPHIPLGLAIKDGIAILERLGTPIQEDLGHEHCYRIETPLFSLAIYPSDGKVESVWYDDPTGRQSESGRRSKVDAYLTRYGPLNNWERRLDNGWMHYWFNPTDQAQMVYGIHKDVIRFNQHTEKNA